MANDKRRWDPMMDLVTVWMTSVLTRARDIRREEGQAAVEYGVLLALILAVAIAFIPGIGTKVADAFSTISAALQ
jgi:Flp pilus assembly pilin Flp